MFQSKGMAGQCQNCHKLQILAKMARVRIENSKGSWNARGMEKFPEFPKHLTPGRSSVPRTAPNRFEKGQGRLCSEFMEVLKLIMLQRKLQSATKYYPLLPGILLRTTKSDNVLRLTAQMVTHKSSCARGAISFWAVRSHTVTSQQTRNSNICTKSVVDVQFKTARARSPGLAFRAHFFNM